MKKFTSTTVAALIFAFIFSAGFSLGTVSPSEAWGLSSIKKAAKKVGRAAKKVGSKAKKNAKKIGKGFKYVGGKAKRKAIFAGYEVGKKIGKGAKYAGKKAHQGVHYALDKPADAFVSAGKKAYRGAKSVDKQTYRQGKYLGKKIGWR